MGITLSNHAMDRFFGFIFRLDNGSKEKIINKLSESIKKNNAESFDLKSLYGAWNDHRTSDEIIADIKNTRVEKPNTAEF